MNSDERTVPDFLDRIVDFPDGITYELREPLTNYRSCHDGIPLEARMVFLASQRTTPQSEEQFVVKVKVQLPVEGQKPESGPSTTTTAELEALTAFRDSKLACVPHLVAFKISIQDDRGPLPGGFISFTVMTKMPGISLFGKYWNMSNSEREEIVQSSVQALRSIYALGVEPIDRGLRNVIWDADHKQCSIIDFELWNKVTETFSDETKELQRWGLVRRPPPRDWWTEWNMHGR